MVSISIYIGLTEFLLSLGSNINHQSKSGRTALWKAAQSGHRHMVHLLRKAGAKLNTQNRLGQTVLFDSIRNSLVISQDLVSAGLDLTLCDIEGNAVLHAAAMLGKTKAVQLFVDHGAYVNVTNEYANAPLHNAAMHCRVATTLHLLNLGAKLNYQNMNGQSAMYLSMVHKHKEITRLLHLAGARLSRRELNMYKDFEAWKYEEKHMFFLWAWSCFNTPMLLSSVARIAIRNSFSDHITPVNAVGTLPLPTVMKKFLLMADVVYDPIIVSGLIPQSSTEDLPYGNDSDNGLDEIICDVCERLLSVEAGSTWYKCTACDDYDLCRSCWNTQAHLEHRNQIHKFEYHGCKEDKSKDCCSCGVPASVIAEMENYVFCCTVCHHFVLCQGCRQDGMHRKHRDNLRVQAVVVG